MKFIVRDKKTGEDRYATAEEEKILIKQHEKAVKNCEGMPILEKVEKFTNSYLGEKNVL